MDRGTAAPLFPAPHPSLSPGLSEHTHLLHFSDRSVTLWKITFAVSDLFVWETHE